MFSLGNDLDGYGYIDKPTTCGSGARTYGFNDVEIDGAGGGVVDIEVEVSLDLFNASISANGQIYGYNYDGSSVGEIRAGGAGGSVLLI